MLGFRVTAFLLSTLFATASFSSSYFTAGNMPELTMTPGKLCDRPTEHRYPAEIPYCRRDVTTGTKNAVFRQYGIDFRDSGTSRADYKIDHLIPLCAGGSNDITNLWPQPKSAYTITDPLEPLLCEQLSEGKIKQEEIVTLIIEAKTHLDRVDSIISYVNRM